jgi:hypothetical protein
LIDADVAVLEESCNAVRAADGLAKKDLLLGHIINKAEKRSDIVKAQLDNNAIAAGAVMSCISPSFSAFLYSSPFPARL